MSCRYYNPNGTPSPVYNYFSKKYSPLAGKGIFLYKDSLSLKQEPQKSTVTFNEYGTEYRFTVVDGIPESGEYRQGNSLRWLPLSSKSMLAKYRSLDENSKKLSAEKAFAQQQASIEKKLEEEKKYELFPGVYANTGQREAIDKMEAFLESNDPQDNVFLLKGRGGTGKTTIVNKALSKFKNRSKAGATVAYEAKEVLQENMKGEDTFTIASLLGLVVDFDKENNMIFRVRNEQEEEDFRSKNKRDPIESLSIIIVDEASMIDQNTFDLLLSKKRPGAKIIFMGDNVQIPPIDKKEEGKEGSKVDSPVWQYIGTKNFAELNERMRQGAESPILPITDLYAENVESIQEGGIGTKNPLIDRVTKFDDEANEGILFINSEEKLVDAFIEDISSSEGLKEAIIVAARNEVVDKINKSVRQKLFDNTEEPFVPGDRLRVNAPYVVDGRVILPNGFKCKVLESKKRTMTEGNLTLTLHNIKVEYTTVDKDGNERTAKIGFTTVAPSDLPKVKEFSKKLVAKAKALPYKSREQREAWREYYDFKALIVEIGYNYAITAHKVQGSTYRSAYVIEEDIMRFPGGVEQVNRMMYTAVSRPRKKLVIFNRTQVATVEEYTAPSTVKKVDGIKEVIDEALQLSSEPVSRSVETTTIKPGVKELFESNPELANTVYEALGFENKLKTTLGKEIEYKDPYVPQSRLKSFKQYEVLNESGDNIGTVVVEYRGNESVILHPKLNVTGKGYGKDLYKLISSKFNVEVQEWSEGAIANSDSAKKMWDSLEKEGTAKRIIDEEQGDNFRVLNYRQEITPQQKQQAQLAYSQYLDSLNKPNTNPILQNNQQEQVKKFIELQERLNNKEFIEGAKNAYESSKGLQEWGTQEQYNDYIARVSLGIIKNPSSGDYNYTSKVKDIVYHASDYKIEKFDKSKIGKNSKKVVDGFYFMDDYKASIGQWGNEYNPSVINIENPDVVETISEFENKKPTGDGIFSKHISFKDRVSKFNEYVVFEPEQIHILGSKQDIEGFENFVSGKPTGEITGIEINSKETGLGNELTNVHYAKDGKSKYDIEPSNKTLTLTPQAKNTWGKSVEAWYKSNNAKSKGIPEGTEGDAYDMKLMIELITDKLKQYPDLVTQITERGGLAFLDKSTHTMGTGRWSSKNPKNMFINALKQAYQNVTSTQSTVTTNNPAEYINHSGGAKGYDAEWDLIGAEFGMVNNKHYLLPLDGDVSDPRLLAKGVKPVDATNDVGPVSLQGPPTGEAQIAVTNAERTMGRIESNHVTRNTKKIRNYAQVKNADAIFAIGSLIPKGSDITISRGKAVKKALVPQVNGGTSVAVQLGITMGKPTYVFNQVANATYPQGWYKWDNTKQDFVSVDTPVLTKNFAGIGTSSNTTEAGKQAIRDVYANTFKATIQPAVESVKGTEISSNAKGLATEVITKTEQDLESAKIDAVYTAGSPNVDMVQWDEVQSRLLQSNDKLLSKDLTYDEMQNVVDSIFYIVHVFLQSNPAGEKLGVNKVFAQYEAFFKAAAEKDPSMAKYLNAFPNIKSAVLNKLDSVGIRVEGKVNRKSKSNDIESDEFTVESAVAERTSYSDNANFTADPKDTASGAMKLFLSCIEDTYRNEEGALSAKPSLLDSRIPRILPLDYVMRSLMETLNGALTLEEMKDRLRESTTTWHNSLLNKLEGKTYSGSLKQNTPEALDKLDQLQHEFFTTFSKQYIEKTSTYHSTTKNKGTSLVPTTMNNTGSAKVLLNNWEEAFKVSDVIRFANGQYELITEELNSIREAFKEIKGKDGHDKLSSLLSKLGVSVTKENLDALASKVERFSKKPYSEAFKEGGFYYSIIHADFGKYGDIKGPSAILPAHMRLIANHLSDERGKVQAGGFRDGKGSKVYGYSNNTYLSKAFNRIKNNYDNFVGRLKEIPFASTSRWANKIIAANKSFIENFRLSYDDVIHKFKSKKSLSRTEQSPREIEMAKISMFCNQGKNVIKGGLNASPGTSIFYYPTLSDKTISPLIESFKEQVIGNVSMGEDGRPKLNNSLVDLLYNSIAVAEADRVKNSQIKAMSSKDPSSLKGYDDVVTYTVEIDGKSVDRTVTASCLFFTLPFLNEFILSAEHRDILYDKAGNFIGTNEDNPAGKALVKALIKQEFEAMVRGTINTWRELGIVTLQKDKATGTNLQAVQSSLFDKSYLSKNFGSNSALLTNNNPKEAYKEVAQIAADLTVNYALANMNLLQLMIGDPALYFKGVKDSNKKLNVKASIAKTMVEVQKRLAKEMAPGLDGSFESLLYDIVILDDLEVGALEEVLKSYPESIRADYARKMNRTDAQEVTTVREHIEVLYAYGRITKSNRDSMIKKIDEAGPGGYYEFTDEELQRVFQPMKPVQVEMYPDADKGVAKVMYIKTSSFPLLPQFTKNNSIDNLRKAMEKNNVARAAFISGVKTGASNIIKPFEGMGFKDELVLTEAMSSNKITLNRSGFRIQQELPYDPEKDAILIGSQLQELIFEGLLDIPKFKELNDRKQDLIKRIASEEKESIMQELGIEVSFGEEGRLNYKITDYQKLSTALALEAANSSNFNINDIKALTLDKKNRRFVIPLWTHMRADKLESLLTSMINNRILSMYMPGKSYAQGSSAGFQLVEDMTKEQRQGIIYTKGYDATSVLRGIRRDEKTGKTLPAEVLLPFNFFNEKGELLNVSDFVDENGILDPSKVPAEVLTMIGYRIPTQGHNSMAPIKVVGFIPASMGDLVIVPGEFAVQMGSDFDIDKLFIHRKSWKYSEGSWILSEDYAKQDALYSIFEEILYSSEVFDRMVEPLGFGKLKDLSDEIKSMKEEASTTWESSFLYHNKQSNDFISQRAGKAGVGFFSSLSVFSALSQTVEKGSIFPYTFKDVDGETVLVTNNTTVNYNGKELSSNSYNDFKGVMGNLKQAVIAAFQSASVDNAKEQILDVLNINGNTFGAIAEMIMGGFDEEYIGYITGQEIIKDFSDTLGIINDTFSYDFAQAEDVLLQTVSRYAESIGLEIKDFAKLEEVIKSSPVKIDNNNLKDAIKTLYKADPNKTKTALKKERQADASYVMTQLYSAHIFYQSLMKYKSLSKVIRAFTFKSKGTGANLLEAAEKQSAFDELNNVMVAGVNKLADSFSERGSLYRDTVEFALSAFSSLFPYDNTLFESVFKRIQENFSYELDAAAKRDIINAYKCFLYSNSNLPLYKMEGINSSKELEDYRKSLLGLVKGEKSLADRLKEYSETEEGKRNYLVDKLSYEVNTFLTFQYKTIRFNGTPYGELDDTEGNRGLLQLLTSKDPVEAKLGRDLVNYALLTGNITGDSSLAKFIPIDYLVATNNSNAIYNMISGVNEDINANLPVFIQQYFRNNPQLASNTKVGEIVKGNLVVSESDFGAILGYRGNAFKKYLSKDGVVYEYTGNNESGQRVYSPLKPTPEEISLYTFKSTSSVVEMDYNAQDIINESPVVNPFSEREKVKREIRESYLNTEGTAKERLVGALNKIISSSTSEWNKTWAEMVLPAVELLNYDKLEESKSSFAMGSQQSTYIEPSYKPSSILDFYIKSLSFNLDSFLDFESRTNTGRTSKEAFEALLLHEVMHSTNSAYINLYKQGIIDHSAVKTFVEETNAIIEPLKKDLQSKFPEEYKEVMRHIETVKDYNLKEEDRALSAASLRDMSVGYEGEFHPYNAKLMYALASESEFHSQIINNLSVQKALSDQKVDGGSTSIMNKVFKTLVKFYTAMAKSIGIKLKPNSVLTKAIESNIKFINNFYTEGGYKETSETTATNLGLSETYDIGTTVVKFAQSLSKEDREVFREIMNSKAIKFNCK